MTNEVKGVGKCPYSPLHNSTAVLVGDRLYAGTTADYQVKETFLFTDIGSKKTWIRIWIKIAQGYILGKILRWEEGGCPLGEKKEKGRCREKNEGGREKGKIASKTG